MKKVLCLILIILVFVVSKAYAFESENDIDYSGINSIFEENLYSFDFNFEEKVNEILSGKNTDAKGFLQKILSFVLQEVRSNFKGLMFLIVFAIFCGLITNFQSSFNHTGVVEISFISIYFVYIYILVKAFNLCYELTKNTMQSEMAFIKAAVPIYVSTVASSGHITMSAGINSTFLLLIQICSELIYKILLPLTYWSFLLSIVNCASNKIQITKIIALTKQTINWILGFSMTFFVGALSLSGLKSASIDKLSIKTVKYAMGSFVPVIGRLLSDTVDTVVSTTAHLRNSIGIVSVIAIIMLCVYPILKLIVITWLYRLAAGIIEPVSDIRLSSIISSCASVIQLMTTMLLTISIVMILAFGIIISLCSLYA